MGYEELPNIKNVIQRNLSAGWFPGKEHNDIPGNLNNPEEEVGMVNGNAVIWYEGALRKLFGFDNVNTSALNSGAAVSSLFYSSVLDEFVGTAGDKIFKGLDTATPTDVTASVVVTAGNQVDWAQWQFETTKYVIGTNQTDPVIKFDGGASAAVLGGTPPQGRWVQVWQNAAWIANTSSEPSTVFFSDLADPETWTTDNDYKFDAPITGMGVLGDFLVVFKDFSIGILSGTNNSALTKIDKYISNIGCSGGHTIRNAKINGQEVLVFHSYDGFYAFDGSRRLLKLSDPIQRKYISGVSGQRWNDSRFEYAYSAYSPNWGWYMCGLSDEDDSENDFLIILDLKRIFQGKNGIYVAHWPVDNINANCIIVGRNSSKGEDIYFGQDDGFVMKFDPTIFNYNGTSYDGYFQSKIFDNINDWIVNEVNILGDQQGATLDVWVNADLEVGDGEFGQADFTGDADVLDSTFILDTSVLGGKDFLLNNVGINNFGRFLQWKISNSTLDQALVVEEMNFVLQQIGFETNAKESTV